MDLAKHIGFVNEQVAFHQAQAEQYTTSNNERRAHRHLGIADRYRELVALLEQLQAQETAKLNAPSKLALTWEEVEGLPEALRAELSISEGDRLEFDIAEIVRDFGGAASLDRLLVELYKRTGEIYGRTWLNNKLYRMMQKQTLFSVPGRKGIYSIEPMDKEEAVQLP